MPPQTGKQLLANMFGMKPNQPSSQIPTSFDQMASAQIQPPPSKGLLGGVGDMMQIVAEMRQMLESGVIQQIMNSGILDEMARAAQTIGDVPGRLDAVERRIDALSDNIGRLAKLQEEILGHLNRPVTDDIVRHERGSDRGDDVTNDGGQDSNT